MITPTIKQQSAIKMVQGNQVSILTGGPGTGKTTTTKIIVEDAIKKKMTILQAAPTGKAAKKMIEATGLYASTIHTMLGCMFENGGFVFAHNKDNRLNADLIILDELSMVTNDLMARVMEAIDEKKTKLLLVGDQDQLPSIGVGAVLRDLLKSKTVPHIELDEIFRNSGKIIECCHAVKNGRVYSAGKSLNLEAESPMNLIHIECDNPEKVLSGIKTIVCDRMPLRGYDIVSDVQVISPVNTKGPLSCKSINTVLRNAINPDKSMATSADIDKPLVFRVGDKVINTKNSQVQKTDNKPTAIVNGDIGIVQKIADKKITILFSDPDRAVVLMLSDSNLLHAYCITCHRFQGSESPVIIIPVCRQFNFHLSNAWIYTALSRGKEIVITIGTFDTIKRAIQNKKANNRMTMLSKRLVDESELHRGNENEFAGI